MARQWALVDEVGQPVADLGDRVEHPIAFELGLRFEREIALAKGMGNGPVGVPILFERLMQGAELVEAPALAKADLAVGDGGPEVDQESARFENTLGFAKGMDHAPFGQSSKRPGEDDEVERCIGETELLGLPDAVRDPVREPSRPLAAGLGDEAPVGVDSGDLMNTQTSQAKRQATLPAADLEDILAPPTCGPPQGSKLVFLGVDTKGHGILRLGRSAVMRRGFANPSVALGASVREGLVVSPYDTPR